MSALDLIAALFLVGGAMLVLLGALGLVAFPDVFTRMHAATKAATVGVIATTVAGSFEAGAAGAVLLLVLVVALLFLSGPLGMSLLARAAYRDRETPRSPHTRELMPAAAVTAQATGALLPGAGPLLAGWLFVAWVALFGSFTPNVLLGGAAVAAAVAMAFRHLTPHWPRALLHPVGAARFVGHFVRQLLASTWGVIVALRRPGDELRPAVIVVPIRVRSRTEVALLMNAISFTPGTVVLEKRGAALLVHVLNTEDPGAVVADIHRMEESVMGMFGTRSGGTS